MQEGETGNAVKKRNDCRTRIEALVVRPPGLQGTAGHVKHFGCLTLTHPLSGELAIAFTLLRPREALPGLLASRIALLRVFG